MSTKHGHFHCDLPQLIDFDQTEKIPAHCLHLLDERFVTPSLCSSTLHTQSLEKTRFFSFTLNGIGMFMVLCWRWFQEFSTMEILEDERSRSLDAVDTRKEIQTTVSLS
ncbi:hypothetical protein, partial [Enterobacter cloacae complex sp. GF14B]|uniref:hypothetical protein n=1 Tax=Enterobacter cloacae complex sp. GF14B TaxID=2511982 RepID=UPI001CA5E1B2